MLGKTVGIHIYLSRKKHKSPNYKNYKNDKKLQKLQKITKNYKKIITKLQKITKNYKKVKKETSKQSDIQIKRQRDRESGFHYFLPLNNLVYKCKV